MTKTEAIEEIQSMCDHLHAYGICDKDSRMLMACKMAISALENIGHLKDRPCSVCEFHKENGCCKWTCVFTDRLFGDMRGEE